MKCMHRKQVRSELEQCTAYLQFIVQVSYKLLTNAVYNNWYIGIEKESLPVILAI